ncbi:AbrB/MazE/SpoVT family DNA-binding domain-containing protein [Candidatus Saccharibacteria bacterium]|nr:AbrB/MazE/SpoVT family DNA-binding domain-containing protein [Candidatus Saccharibacteria bacterium]
MIFSSTITKTGQVFLPKTVRTALGLSPGQRISFDLKNDTLILKKTKSLDELIQSFDKNQSEATKKAIESYRGLSSKEALEKWANSPEGQVKLKEKYARTV